jgi:hypothetical protein
MAITELPPAPTSGNPTNFSNKGDALLGSFATFITQTNSTSADVDTKSTNVDTKNTNVNTKQQQASLDEASALASKNSSSASASVTVTKANDCVAPTDTTIAKALEASNSESSALTSAITTNNTVLNVVSNRASIRPTLLLDFAKTKFMDPRVTFTRSSVATVTDSLGVIRTVASDVPRFDHDPVTGESLGLLMEEGRTNLLLNSATLVTQNVTVTAAAYSLSFYGAGTVTLSGTATVTVTGFGAYPSRSTLTFTPTAGTLTLTVSGSCTDAQLELGAFTTSIIPTVSSQVTRASDSAVITGSNFSSWYKSDEGTIYVDYILGYKLASIRVVAFSDGTSSNYMEVIAGAGSVPSVSNGPYFYGAVLGNAGEITLSNATTNSPNSRRVFAGAYKLNDFAGTQGGLTPVFDTTARVPVVDRLIFGNSTNGGSALLNGTIKKLAFYPKRLSNTELVGITQ